VRLALGAIILISVQLSVSGLWGCGGKFRESEGSGIAWSGENVKLWKAPFSDWFVSQSTDHEQAVFGEESAIWPGIGVGWNGFGMVFEALISKTFKLLEAP
jgi:hypothetical protein